VKILVFGNAGSGKTTLARRIGAEHRLAVLDLDNVVWSPAEAGVFRADAEIVEALAMFVQANRSWIIEGCYGKWMEHLLPQCTEIIFCNPPEEVCLANCRARPWEPTKFKTKEEQDTWLPALLDWVRAYYTRTDDRSLTAHRRLFDAFEGTKREILANGTADSAVAHAIPKLPEFLPITTQRLTLRRFTARDVTAFHTYRNDPKVARYQSWEECSETEAREFVAQQEIQPFGVPGQWLQIAIALKESDELIGDCAVRIHPQDSRQATIGGTLSRPYQRHGYAAETLSCLFDCLFVHAKLHRVVADADVKNTSAWRLMEQLGMRREGHLKQSLWFKGGWADEYLYAILRDEWNRQPGRTTPSSFNETRE
jgi:RimJ/RimL family protein N-acetyltransferase/adenylate kinase family enzyme